MRFDGFAVSRAAAAWPNSRKPGSVGQLRKAQSLKLTSSDPGAPFADGKTGFRPGGVTQKTKYAAPRESASVQRGGKVGRRGTASTYDLLDPPAAEERVG